jgi:DNA invertase Pin-like site-specific DNA recombinase
VFHVFAALSEFLRELIVAGTREGLAASDRDRQAPGRQRRDALHTNNAFLAAALAALVPLPARYAELERDELAAIDAVLAAGGTWEQIAQVLALGSRQAVRQHGQRLRARVKQRLADQGRPRRQGAHVAGHGRRSAISAPPAASNQPSPTLKNPNYLTDRRSRSGPPLAPAHA